VLGLCSGLTPALATESAEPSAPILLEDIITFHDFLLGLLPNRQHRAARGIASNFVAVPDIATSLSTFVLGGWVMGRLGNFLGCRQGGWLILLRRGFNFNIAAQIILEPITLVIIVLLALAAGGHVTMARSQLPMPLQCTRTHLSGENLNKLEIRSRHWRFLLC
jgi:hypothetical protein